MSTILKALKKLEQEKQRQRDAGTHESPVWPGSAAANRFPGGRWLAAPWIRRGLVLILVLGLGGAAFYFYRLSLTAGRPDAVGKAGPEFSPARDTRVAPSTTAGHVRKDMATVQMQPVEDQADHTRAIADAGRSGGKRPSVPKRSETMPRPLNSKAAVQGTQTKAPVQRQPTFNVTQTAGSDVGPMPASQLPVDESRTVEPSPQPVAEQTSLPADRGNRPAEPEYPNAILMTDGRLKVQALAWSPNIDDRMAVINTRIVHEGDKVEGFAILAIGHDDVIVSEKGVIYRVVFGQP